MNTYTYEAVNAAGLSSSGFIEVASQNEAVRRIKEMGLFPTRVTERRPHRIKLATTRPNAAANGKQFQFTLFEKRVKPAAVAVLTRQIATLSDAGLPLLRGLKILREQESHPTLKRIVGEISETIEGGGTLSEALAQHPKVFNKLYVNMVRAGEAGGALEISLRRLAEFMEKALKIKNKVKSALFYPVAVLCVAIGVIATPASAAQSVADDLVVAGVTSILNFAPCVLSVPPGVDVRKVDLAVELQILSFHEHRKASLTALPGGLTATDDQEAVGS